MLRLAPFVGALALFHPILAASFYLEQTSTDARVVKVCTEEFNERKEKLNERHGKSWMGDRYGTNGRRG